MPWKVQSFVEVAMIRKLFLAVIKFVTEVKNLEGIILGFSDHQIRKFVSEDSRRLLVLVMCFRSWQTSSANVSE